jgi:nucleotide-binding universal stress UspA family protein
MTRAERRDRPHAQEVTPLRERRVCLEVKGHANYSVRPMSENLSAAPKKDERPIVCGTDFSSTAVEAVDIAAEMARRLNVKLFLLHVDEFSGLAVSHPSLFEQVVLKNRLELEREAERLRKAGTKVDQKLLSGSVFNELVDAAAESNARLIIVGAVGHGVARRLFVGSVAERVAETSAVPTLVVRPGSRLGSWIRGEHALKVLVGYDFSAASDAALHWLNEMQALGACETLVVHVDFPPDEAQRLGYRGPLPLTRNPEQMKNFLERDLTERVAMLLPPEKVTLRVEPGWGRTDGYLFQKANQEKADLVLVGTHRRHGWGRLRFGSVSRNVLHNVRMSVAVVPPKEEQERPLVPKLNRVLVATDFSDLGNKAVPYGCAVLRRGGTLKLIHVIHAPGAPVGKNKPRPAKENPKLQGQLRSLLPTDAQERLDVETEIVESNNAAEGIAQAAERFDADAICLGSHGRSGLAETLLGSVAQAVVQSSKRPVLIVRS